MAFETGSATDIHDLLENLRIFAIANGWAVELMTAHSRWWTGLSGFAWYWFHDNGRCICLDQY